MKMHRILILNLLIIISAPALSQSYRYITLEGVMKGGSIADSFTVYVKGLLPLPLKEIIKVGANGRFRKEILITVNNELFIACGDEDSIMLFPGERSSIYWEWDKRDYPRSFKILDTTDYLNQYMIAYQKAFWNDQDQIQQPLDSATSLDQAIKTIRSQNERQFDFLRRNGKQLSKIEYQKCATDIFYSNLDKIIVFPRFREFDFSTPEKAIQFPFITLYNAPFDTMQNKAYQRLKRENPSLAPEQVRKFSLTESEGIFRTAYTIMDTIALYQSAPYRQFLYNYFTLLLENINYRKIRTGTLGSINSYARLLDGMIDNKKIARWLIASQVQGRILSQSVNDYPVEVFNKDLALVEDPDLTIPLTKYYHLFAKLNAGTQAPVITFHRENGQLDSTTNYKGKYIFIDVWSSYCAPCLQQIAQLSETTYNRLKGRNIIFLYVSLDESRQKWLESVHKYKPTGINGIATAGWRSPFVGNYSIFSVPRYILISPEGTIVNANFPGLSKLTEGMLIKQ